MASRIAEPALAIADREHERADDQPHRAFGKPTQHPAQRFTRIGLDVSHNPGKGEANETNRTDGHRLKHQTRNHRREDGKVMPLVGVHARWDRQQVNHKPNTQQSNRLPFDLDERVAAPRHRARWSAMVAKFQQIG
jgi:hypothetical protein